MVLPYIALLCILLILVLVSYPYPRKRCETEAFEDTRKTIYLVWRNTVDPSLNHGIGDKIRGAICLFQYCKNNNIRLVVDGTDDICGKFLKNVKTDSYSIIKDQKLTIMIDVGDQEFIDKITNTLNTSNEMFIYTNKYPLHRELLSNDDKQFAKWICESVDSLKEEIEVTIRKLPSQYGIQHFRFNDNIFTNDLTDTDPTFTKYFTILETNYTPTDILLSNSLSFKKYAKERLNIKTIDCNDELCKIQHIGTTTDADSAKATFIEFFIISRSKYIKTISPYTWVSGFVAWPSLIYDIPLTPYPQ